MIKKQKKAVATVIKAPAAKPQEKKIDYSKRTMSEAIAASATESQKFRKEEDVQQTKEERQEDLRRWFESLGDCV